MRESKIVPWLADATKRLRLLHIEIDAKVRRLVWGEELDQEHTAALLAAIAKANNIQGMLTRYAIGARINAAAREEEREIDVAADSIGEFCC